MTTTAYNLTQPESGSRARNGDLKILSELSVHLSNRVSAYALRRPRRNIGKRVSN
ncbi:hypothetical protein PQX77_012306, partial [Marasmius sp. AFHP31]